MTEKAMKRLGYEIIDYIVAHCQGFNEASPSRQSASDTKRSLQVSDKLPVTGEDPSTVFAELNGLMKENSSHQNHPHSAYIPGSSNYYSILSDVLAVGHNAFDSNSSGDSASVMIETRTVSWLNQLVGFPAETAGGLFVTDRPLANLTGIVTARTSKLGENHGHGTIYYANQTHSTLDELRRAIGLGVRNMRKVAIGKDFRIDLTDLRRLLAEDVAAGYTPCCIIGNAGTMSTGTVDDLYKMRAIADEYDAWLHIDGTYGGAAILSEEYKHEVAGIETADSITLNPQQWCFQPYEMGCLLVRDKRMLKENLTVRAEHIYNIIKSEVQVNFNDSEVELSRSFRALKLYTYFRCEGLKKIGGHVTQGIKNADFLRDLFDAKSYWEVLSNPSIGNISFRARINGSVADNDALNEDIYRSLAESVYAKVNTTKIHGHVALWMCPIHPDTTEEALREAVRCMEVVIEKAMRR